MKNFLFIAFTAVLLQAHGETTVIVTDGLAKFLQESRAWQKEYAEGQKQQEVLKTILENIKKSVAEQDRADREDARNLKKHEGSKIKYEELMAEHETFRKDQARYRVHQEGLKKLIKDLELAQTKFESTAKELPIEPLLKTGKEAPKAKSKEEKKTN